MQVSMNSIQSRPVSNPSFGLINQKYLKKAAQDHKYLSTVSADWMYKLGDEVKLWKTMSKKDALDTVNAARRYVNPGSLECYNDFFKFLSR